MLTFSFLLYWSYVISAVVGNIMLRIAYDCVSGICDLLALLALSERLLFPWLDS
jgi:hypothetical protein